jgi:alkaline phosphatase D
MTRDALPGMDRRALVRHALAVAAAGLAPVRAVAEPQSRPRLHADPFAMLGVASGDPWPTGVVLWTRLALDLSDPDSWGLGERSYAVDWEVLDADAPGRGAVRSGRTSALRGRGYAVHVEVDGLQPGRSYRYRFRTGDYSVEGTTRTAPAVGQPLDRLRFAFASCAEYENERYYAYDLMAADAPDFVVHLGDYIYNGSYSRFWPPGTAARRLAYDTDAPVATLAQYRRRYAEYRAEEDGFLRRLHSVTPFIVTWDDHEFANDYAAEQSELRDENKERFVARRAAAYRAYFENLPLRLSSLSPLPRGGRRLHRDFAFGDLLRLFVLDTRQYRSPQPCPWGARFGGRLVSEHDCPDISSPRRTMLGAGQERWLSAGLSQAKERWSVLASGVPFAVLDGQRERRAMAGAIGSDRNRPHVWTDSWSGYLGARQRLVDLIASHRQKNPIVISGDIHNHFVNNIFADWTRPGTTPLVATEFTTTAISSRVRDLGELAAANAASDGKPGTVVWHEGKSHGYVLCDVTRDAFEATMVTVKDKNPIARTARADKSVRFTIAAGDPRARRN